MSISPDKLGHFPVVCVQPTATTQTNRPAIISDTMAVVGTALVVVSVLIGHKEYLVGCIAGLVPKEITEHTLAKKIKQMLPLEMIADSRVTHLVASILFAAITSSSIPGALAFFLGADNIIDLKDYLLSPSKQSLQSQQPLLHCDFHEEETEEEFSLIHINKSNL